MLNVASKTTSMLSRGMATKAASTMKNIVVVDGKCGFGLVLGFWFWLAGGFGKTTDSFTG